MSEHVHIVTQKVKSGASCGSAYGLGFIGALVFFLQNSTGFWNGALGVVKAIIWPALLVYKALEFLP